MKILLIILFILFIMIALPICVIGSLNTLFPALDIPTNLQTWISMLLIIFTFGTPRLKVTEEDEE